MKTIQTQKPKKSQNSASSVSRKELLDERGKFKKGHPKVGGSKKGSSFSLLAILKKELQKIPKELKGKERKRYADLLIKKQIHKAIVEGDDASIRLIWSYIEGAPKQAIDANLLGEIIFKWKNEKKSK